LRHDSRNPEASRILDHTEEPHLNDRHTATGGGTFVYANRACPMLIERIHAIEQCAAAAALITVTA
jgi:hypothetical protein